MFRSLVALALLQELSSGSSGQLLDSTETIASQRVLLDSADVDSNLKKMSFSTMVPFGVRRGMLLKGLS